MGRIYRKIIGRLNKDILSIKKILNLGSRSTNCSFKKIKNKKRIYLYAGDIVGMEDKFREYIGLSLTTCNENHIKHDITHTLPLKDNSVDRFQAEDVFEHIEIEKIPSIINEIYRILKPEGVFRLSIPDYRTDILRDRSVVDEHGTIIFDPYGGGDFVDGKVINGGHVWFPIYENVNDLLKKSLFTKCTFYHYYDNMGIGITKPIDYSIGFIRRTPDHDDRVKDPYRPMSIVVDCIKE